MHSTFSKITNLQPSKTNTLLDPVYFSWPCLLCHHHHFWALSPHFSVSVLATPTMQSTFSVTICVKIKIELCQSSSASQRFSNALENDRKSSAGPPSPQGWSAPTFCFSYCSSSCSLNASYNTCFCSFPSSLFLSGGALNILVTKPFLPKPTPHNFLIMRIRKILMS